MRPLSGVSMAVLDQDGENWRKAQEGNNQKLHVEWFFWKKIPTFILTGWILDGPAYFRVWSAVTSSECIVLPMSLSRKKNGGKENRTYDLQETTTQTRKVEIVTFCCFGEFVTTLWPKRCLQLTVEAHIHSFRLNVICGAHWSFFCLQYYIAILQHDKNRSNMS